MVAAIEISLYNMHYIFALQKHKKYKKQYQIIYYFDFVNHYTTFILYVSWFIKMNKLCKKLYFAIFYILNLDSFEMLNKKKVCYSSKEQVCLFISRSQNNLFCQLAQNISINFTNWRNTHIFAMIKNKKRDGQNKFVAKTSRRVLMLTDREKYA